LGVLLKLRMRYLLLQEQFEALAPPVLGLLALLVCMR
jgi:hypothetical protein